MALRHPRGSAGRAGALAKRIETEMVEIKLGHQRVDLLVDIGGMKPVHHQRDRARRDEAHLAQEEVALHGVDRGVVKDFIPPELVDKIATEEDAKNVDELKAFLKAKNHPVVAKWEAEEAPAAEAQTLQVAEEAAGTMMPVATAGTLPIMAGGFKIILKDAKIYANKVIIQTIKNDKDKR